MKAKSFFVLVLLALGASAFSGVYKSNVEASYYADKFHGRKTANGEVFNMYALTCAHKTLPFGTMLRVTNLANNKSVEVRVNDRGPFVKGREIDLSKAAAQKLDMIKTGTANVRIEIISSGGSAGRSATESGAKAAAAQSVNTARADYWDVQVGSFSSHENANKLAQKLLRNGFENVYFQKTSSVTRVVLKKVPDANLRSTENKLRQNGYTDYVVKKTKQS